MAIDTSTLADYSWSDIAIAAKQAMVKAALGGNTLMINGRNVGRISIDDAKVLYEFATQQAINEASPNDGGIILVELR